MRIPISLFAIAACLILGSAACSGSDDHATHGTEKAMNNDSTLQEHPQAHDGVTHTQDATTGADSIVSH